MTPPRNTAICMATRKHFSDYLDGQPLPWWWAFQVRLHVAMCPFCRPVYRSLKATQDALNTLKSPEP